MIKLLKKLGYIVFGWLFMVAVIYAYMFMNGFRFIFRRK